METSMENIKMEGYPAYKESGIEWIGVIPEHWCVKKITHIFRKIGSGTTPTAGVSKYYDDGEVNWLQTGDLNNGLINKTSKKITQKALSGFSTLKMYPVGSLVVAMYGATIGKVGLLDIETTTNQACCVLAFPNEFSTKFGFYWFVGSKLHIISLSYGGGQPNISQDTISSLRLPIPPLTEQTRIAHFLDQKTAQIDQAIAQKERLIELLKERRQILIHNAVTRGLDPNVRMKDSGVEWIGEVPEGWAIKRLKNVCDMLVSNVDKHTKPLEHPVRLCNYVDVYKNEFITSGINFMEATATTDEIRRFVIKIDDVVITKDSEDWLDIGVPALVKYEEKKLICGYHLAILRPNNSTIGGFLHRAILSQYIRTQFSVKANGVTRYGISHGAILGTFIAEPPKEEQQAISSFIDTATQKIATAITCKQSEIEKLKEYKATLINSAVTGKIKV
jgi:type I restriction enzyme S subunit